MTVRPTRINRDEPDDWDLLEMRIAFMETEFDRIEAQLAREFERGLRYRQKPSRERGNGGFDGLSWKRHRRTRWRRFGSCCILASDLRF